MLKFKSNSHSDTIKFGRVIGNLLEPGFIVGLYGDLGSGKTTLVKGIVSSLGINKNEINSPSFVLIKEYQGKLPLYHLDLYRLDNISQIEKLGYEEYLFGNGVCVVEWAEKLNGLMPDEHIEIKLFHKGENKRLLKVIPKGKKYRGFFSGLVKRIK